MLEAQSSILPENQFVVPAPPRRIVSIAAFRDTRAALQDALGIALPDTPRRVVAGGVTLLWSGPARWLAIGDDPAMQEKIASAGMRRFAAVTEQGSGRAIVLVRGPSAGHILAKLVPVDLHPEKFPADATALTLAGHIAVQLWREADGFALAVARSYADSLGHALIAASHEFLGG